MRTPIEVIRKEFVKEMCHFNKAMHTCQIKSSATASEVFDFLLSRLQATQKSDAIDFVLWLHNNGWSQSSDHRYHYKEINSKRESEKTKVLYQLFISRP
jgi:hypothetical protein